MVENNLMKDEESVSSQGLECTSVEEDQNNSLDYTVEDDLTEEEQQELKQKVAEKSAELDNKTPSGCFIGVIAFMILSAIGASFASNGETVVALFLIVMVVVAVKIIYGTKSDEELENLKEKIKTEQANKREIMKEIFDQASEEGFIKTSLVTDVSNRYCLAIDDSNKKILIKNTPENKYKIYAYDDLVSFEIVENGETTISDNFKGAIKGGILFGATGAVVGALSQNPSQICNSLSVVITVNDFEEFRISLNLIEKTTLKGSDSYKMAALKAEEMVSLLRIIQSHQSSVKDSSPLNDDETKKIEALKKYKELLDMEVITKEEFDLTKKRLMGL